MAPSAALYPRQLGRYTLIAPLGEGGMAAVHVARREGDPRICVLKQLHAELASHADSKRRFQREAHIASFLQHPGIAHVVDAGVEDGIFCIALEFIAGQTVEQIVKAARSRGGTLPFEVAVEIMDQALDALDHAHGLRGDDGQSLGLVHRDLSPRNVMVGYDGQVKIIDFGIAKGRVDDHRTAAGTLMGTPYYMSPEQARGVQLDHRSDLYTLSAVFFEMVTGRRLVQARGRANILMSVVHDRAPSLLDRNPHAPAALAPVVARGLEKRPGHRYESARALRDELEAARAEARLRRLGPEKLGEFLRNLTPGGEAQARALLERVRAEASPDLARSVAEETRLAPTPTAGVVASTRIVERAGPPLEPTMFGLPGEPTRAADFSTLPPSVTRSGVARRGSSGVHTRLAGVLGALLLAGLGFGAGLWWRRAEPRRAPATTPLPAKSYPPQSPPAVVAAPAPSSAPAEASDGAPVPRPRIARAPSAGRTPARPRQAGRRRRRDEAPRTPPSTAAGSARSRTVAELRKDLAAVRRRPSVERAFTLADRMRAAAGRYLEGTERSKVEAETDRIMRTGDVEAMIEALSLALRTLEEG